MDDKIEFYYSDSQMMNDAIDRQEEVQEVVFSKSYDL